MNRGGRACRYGEACRNPACPFDHTSQAPPTPLTQQMPSSVCRYGTGCRRQDCKYIHPSSSQNSPSYSQYAPTTQSYQAPCRFGAECFTTGCRFSHPQLTDSYDDVPEFTPEEEEFMDEILDMIEQEQQTREVSQDSDDERNINEILDFIEHQPSQQTVFESEYILPEEAEREHKAMMEHQQHQQDAPTDLMLAGMNRMNIKGMSATAQPFVPRSATS